MAKDRENPNCEAYEGIAPLREKAMAGIRSALIRVDRRFDRVHIDADTSLVSDLRLDSLLFVNLTVAIEDILEIRELPFQDWYDLEAQSDDSKKFTVGALARFCVNQLESGRNR